MFYLFLIVLSFTELYFFRLLNQVLFHGTDLSGDLIFAASCILLTVLILIGTLHIKHLNRQWIKKLSIGIMIFSIIYFLASCISMKFNYIISSFEFSIIFIVIGVFLYFYETAPEGEPDVEVTEPEEDDFTLDYIEEPVDYEDFESFPVYQEEVYENEDLLNLNNLIIQIEDNSNPEEFEIKLGKTKDLIENIFRADSEYREENLNNLTSILTIYNNELENNKDSSIIKEIDDSIDLINSNLENLYYNTRGAQVFQTEKKIKALNEKLEDLLN